MLLVAWIAKWLCVFPEGRDELPEGNSQQLPDSGRYRRYRPNPQEQEYKPKPEVPATNLSYNPDAKARARKAQRENDKAHVVKKRNVKIEDNFDDCGEDQSSFNGVKLCPIAWTSLWNEDAAPLTSSTAHAQ